MKIYFVNDIHINNWCKTTDEQALEYFYKENFLPADVLCIAGDIANEYEDIYNILAFLKTKYPKIIYTLGNHDHGLFQKDKYKIKFHSSYEKMNKIAHDFEGNLNGNIIEYNGITFGGACGGADWSYCYKNFNTSYDEFFNKYQTWFDCRWWRKNNVEPKSLFEEEYAKLISAAKQKPKIFISHFQPLTIPTADSYKNDLYTGFFNYDDTEINTLLEPGTIYHYGHTHTKIKKEINGILYINNCIGYPEELNIYAFGQYKKEDFLLEF